MAVVASLGPAGQEVVRQLAIEGVEEGAEVLVAVRRGPQISGPRSRSFRLLHATPRTAGAIRAATRRPRPAQPGRELTGEGLHGRAVDDAAAPELVVPPSETAELIEGRLAAADHRACQVGQRRIPQIEHAQHPRPGRGVGGERLEARARARRQHASVSRLIGRQKNCFV